MSTRRATICVLTIALLGALAGTAAADAGPTQDRSTVRLAQNDTNETTQHTDPEDSSGEGSRSAIQGWLTSSMIDRLENNAISLSREEYELARSFLGDGYNADLGRYVNVAGDTETDTDNRAGQVFNETAEKQLTYNEQVQTFRSTYEEYQTALANNNTARTRQLARELDRQQNRINETASELTELYESLENLTGEPLTEGQETILETTENVTSISVTALDQSLIDTDLQVDTVSPAGSFRDPIVVTGQFVTDNGTAIPGTAVTLDTPRQVTATTVDNGSFRLSYRPVAIETGTRNLTLTATPANQSAYRADAAAITTTVEAVDPTLTIGGIPDTVAYKQPVSPTVSVTVDGRPVNSTSLEISLDDISLLDGRTGEPSTPRLPADVRTGQRTLTVAAGREGTAIARNVTTRSLSVQSTATNLTVSVDNGSSVAISGVLRTSDNTAVSSQLVQIRVDGEVADTVRTNAAGAYETTLNGDVLPTNETVPISAVYPGAANLDRSNASATAVLIGTGNRSVSGGQPESDDRSIVEAVTSPVADAASSVEDATRSIVKAVTSPVADAASSVEDATGVDSTVILLAVGVVALVILTGGGYVWYRRRDEISSPAPTPEQSDNEQSEDADQSERPLSDVRSQLSNDQYDDAAVTLYQIVQSSLPVEPRSELTHWERYRRARETLTAREADVLESVTALYQHARYAPSSVQPDEVTDTLDDGQDLLEPDADQTADD